MTIERKTVVGLAGGAYVPMVFVGMYAPLVPARPAAFSRQR
jgi:hypothetical protein